MDFAALHSVSNVIVGAFIFSNVWESWSEDEAGRRLEALAGFGVNTIFTESESYRDDLIVRAHAFGMHWFGGLAWFSDHARGNRAVHERPELWPIDEAGRRRPQMEWYMGVTPTYEDYSTSRLELAERLVRDHDLNGFFFDFIRWPVHWELEFRAGAPRPLQSSFDPHTLSRFQAEAKLDLPGDLTDGRRIAAWILEQHPSEWTNFKCRVITETVREAAARLRSARPGMTLGLYSPPLPSGLLESYAGQRLPELARSVDLISPMAYHAILHQPVEWVPEILRDVSVAVSHGMLPVLQADSAEGAESGADWGPPIPADEWEQAVHAARGVSGARGLIAFTGTALFRDGRGERLRAALAAA